LCASRRVRAGDSRDIDERLDPSPMPRQNSVEQARATVVESAIVEQFLSVRPPKSPADLHTRLRDRFTDAELDAGTAALVASGVVGRTPGRRLLPGRPLVHLDRLGLLSV
jgi:hypothetical protein